MNQQELKTLLHYDPPTGVFRWRHEPKRGMQPWDVAGSVERGYVRIQAGGKLHRAHRLAWLYVHGEWPSSELDHINRNRADNRIENLRLADRSLNMQNIGKKASNSSGYVGVSMSKWAKRWQAQIKTNGKNVHLGYYDTPELAHQAYLLAKANHHAGLEKNNGTR